MLVNDSEAGPDREGRLNYVKALPASARRAI
jgi:hypothetical protein